MENPSNTNQNRVQNRAPLFPPPTNSLPTEKSLGFPFYSASPLTTLVRSSPSSTPLRIFKRPFPPPSPAKHIRAFLACRNGSTKPNEVTIPEGKEVEIGLDKSFGFSKQFGSHYEIDGEVGRGHFWVYLLKGSLKGQEVAVKVIPKSKAILKSSTNAMKDSRVLDFVHMISCLQYKKLGFEEFCASALSVYQMEAMETWEQHARRAYELFEKDGNRPIMIEELALELGLGRCTLCFRIG